MPATGGTSASRWVVTDGNCVQLERPDATGRATGTNQHGLCRAFRAPVDCAIIVDRGLPTISLAIVHTQSPRSSIMRVMLCRAAFMFAVISLVGAGQAADSGAPSASSAPTWSYADLVGQMLDLEHLAVLPWDGERCAQWSSWDRVSQYDADSGKYVHWDANNDGPMVIREENGRAVMAEMEGPGCIWRIWSARAEQGHVKIYLDDATEPAIDLPFRAYFQGDTAPFNYPQLSYNLQDLGCRGQNLYFPIPYQKSCKIVADPGWGRYYHFTYATYPKGTRVPTFSPALAAQHAESLRRVNDFFESSLGDDPAGRRDGEQRETGTLWLEPGESAALTIDGPRAITALRGKTKFRDREDEMAALRRLVLRITFDGQPAPAVWCPLGDFFGTAPGWNPYRTLLTGLTDEGGYALWYMPFARGATIELLNQDTTSRELEYDITHAPLRTPMDELGYFHCYWHRDTVELPADRWPDWTMLNTRGRGRFCGVMLHVWNPRGGWWGEGDEKFFVDGEKFPSTFGTGSEDYFGYAWCHPGLFQRAYHAQTMTQNNKGHQSVLRWHVTDNVPFQSEFEGCIEKYYRTQERGTQYAAVVCWYLAAGGTHPYSAVPVAERDGYYINPPVTAGGFTVLNDPPGEVRTQTLRQHAGHWENDDQLWWTGAKPGAKLEVAVPVEKAGTYRISVALTKARDYGIVQLRLDGQRIGEPLDLYNPTVVSSGPIELGQQTLSAGQHKLTVEIVGANPAAVPSYMFGLDRVILDPAP